MLLKLVNNINTKDLKLNISNTICTWGNSNQWYCITQDSLSEESKKNLVNLYNQDKSSVMLNEVFFLEDDVICFELSVNGEVVGLLALRKSFDWEDEDEEELGSTEQESSIDLTLESFFILKAFRGKGLGQEFAFKVANYIGVDIINTLSAREPKKDEFLVNIHADYDSKDGEYFTHNFAENLSNESAFSEVLKSMNITPSFCLDAGY